MHFALINNANIPESALNLEGSVTALLPVGSGANQLIETRGNVMDLWGGMASFSKKIEVSLPLNPSLLFALQT